MRLTNYVKLLFIILFPSLIFADGLDQTATIIYSLYYLAKVFAIFLGLFLMVLGGIKLKAKAEQPNNRNASTPSIIFCFLIGAALFNYNAAISTFTTTLTGHEYCEVQATVGNSIKVEDYSSKCFDADSTEIIGKAADKIEKISGEERSENYTRGLEVLSFFIQFLGFIWFIKGFYSLKKMSEGTDKAEYGKAWTAIAVSALLVDLPHTLTIILDTAESMGFNLPI